MTNNTLLRDYIQAFQTLTEDSLPQLGALFSEEVFFKDPFNAVTGRQATLAIFEHMFATTNSPKFMVMDAAMDGQIGLLYWQFHFIMPSNQLAQKIEGMSRIKFNDVGLVCEHIDYWDAAEQVYSKVPVLNWFINQVKKRLSACKFVSKGATQKP